MKDFRNFVVHNCVLNFDAEQVYLKLQVTNPSNIASMFPWKNPVTVNSRGKSELTMYVFVCICLLSSPLSADLGPGPEGASEVCATGRGVYFLRLSPATSGLARRRGAHSWTEIFLSSPPTSGLRRRRWRRGAQLDGNVGKIALYASRPRLRAWPGGGGGGVRSWTGIFAFYTSRHRLRAWPGWGGGGAHSWTVPTWTTSIARVITVA